MPNPNTNQGADVTRHMSTDSMSAVARALVEPGKGILAADESLPSIEKRFKKIHLESTAENRRAYRELLFTAPELAECISGVILFSETIRQKSQDGTRLIDVLARQGIIPGVKVDTGTHPFEGSPSEKITEGLDGLSERLEGYFEDGARFTKWRAVITIGAGTPTRGCIEANTERLAGFAALSQEAGMVPIVEPEVLMNGDHDIQRCFDASVETLLCLFGALSDANVVLESTVLKTNMVLSGTDCEQQASTEEIAELTLKALGQCVPAAIPGIVFLSGGQTSEQATDRLNMINVQADNAPWHISFSYGRALQNDALHRWNGGSENTQIAQEALSMWAKRNGQATLGTYDASS